MSVRSQVISPALTRGHKHASAERWLVEEVQPARAEAVKGVGAQVEVVLGGEPHPGPRVLGAGGN
jgi:hypothetical protein